MAELALILVGALLVNNFVLAQFLGLCPFMGITKSYDTALATGVATTTVRRPTRSDGSYACLMPEKTLRW